MTMSGFDIRVLLLMTLMCLLFHQAMEGEFQVTCSYSALSSILIGLQAFPGRIRFVHERDCIVQTCFWRKMTFARYFDFVAVIIK